MSLERQDDFSEMVMLTKDEYQRLISRNYNRSQHVGGDVAGPNISLSLKHGDVTIKNDGSGSAVNDGDHGNNNKSGKKKRKSHKQFRNDDSDEAATEKIMSKVDGFRKIDSQDRYQQLSGGGDMHQAQSEQLVVEDSSVEDDKDDGSQSDVAGQQQEGSGVFFTDENPTVDRSEVDIDYRPNDGTTIDSDSDAEPIHDVDPDQLLDESAQVPLPEGDDDLDGGTQGSVGETLTDLVDNAVNVAVNKNSTKALSMAAVKAKNRAIRVVNKKKEFQQKAQQRKRLLNVIKDRIAKRRAAIDSSVEDRKKSGSLGQQQYKKVVSTPAGSDPDANDVIENDHLRNKFKSRVRRFTKASSHLDLALRSREERRQRRDFAAEFFKIYGGSMAKNTAEERKNLQRALQTYVEKRISEKENDQNIVQSAVPADGKVDNDKLTDDENVSLTFGYLY